ncbi:MAG: hypothetical protein ACLFOY_02310 [Desulfatibacillaceae bacterium]
MRALILGKPILRAALVPLLACVLLLASAQAMAAEDVCARVKIEIVQELTFERVAFDAKMKITNGLDMPLESIRVDVYLLDGTDVDVTNIFYVREDSMDGINSVDGTGTVAAGGVAEIHWLIVPSPGAGGEDPEGIRYFAGATLSYTAGGNTETMDVDPDEILVKPQPLLVLDYFLPRDVFGDNPFTSETEPPIPYDLGVRVQNTGFGTAGDLKIESGQPRIVENDQGLLIDFRIIGSTVNGMEATPSLKVDFGDIDPATCGTARWQMISSLTGTFIDFEATFTHADELGGELTSLIDSVNTHFLEHNVMVDRAGRDFIRDFLGEDGGTYQVWESDNYINPVENVSSTSTLTSLGGGVYELAVPMAHDFIFVQKNAPTQGRVPIDHVFRSDGKAIKEENYWIKRERGERGAESFYLCLFDVDTSGSYTFTYDYDQAEDTTPPVSRISVGDPSVGYSPVYLTSATELLFLSDDPQSGVKDMQFNIDDGDQGPWEAVVNPFMFSQRPALGDGAHTLWYYATNTINMDETPKSTSVFVDDDPPTALSLAAAPTAFMPGAPAGMAADQDTLISFSYDDAVPQTTAEVQIAQGSWQAYSFDTLPVVRTYNVDVVTASGGAVLWDGTDDNGALLGAGTYSVRFIADDGLGHVTCSTPIEVEVQAYLDDEAVSSGSGDQMYPDVYGTTVVWQDDRDGNWEIYRMESNAETNITSNAADQQNPAITADWIVWQDFRNGDWDIYHYNRNTQAIAGFDRDGDQTNPDVDGNWLVYQDNSTGNWEIWAVDLSAGTPTPARISDNNERDQVKPSVSGNLVVWEDYRFGKPEIYLYDSLPTGVLKRVTVQEDHYQTSPVISGQTILFVDTRNQQTDIYAHYIPTLEERRLTYNNDNEVQVAVQGDNMAYVRFVAQDNPDIAWGGSQNGLSSLAVAHAARQEEPALYGNLLVWQDDRLGRWQVYQTTVNRNDIVLEIRPGMNLLAAPAEVVEDPATDTSFELLADWNGRGLGITRLLQYDTAGGVYREATWDTTNGAQGADFTLTARTTLAVWADIGGSVPVATLAAETAMPLVQGLNTPGFAAVPSGLTAWDMAASIGLENVASIRGYDSETGLFTTVAVQAMDDGQGGTTYVVRGRDFAVGDGAGVLVHMARPVAGWRP